MTTGLHVHRDASDHRGRENFRAGTMQGRRAVDHRAIPTVAIGDGGRRGEARAVRNATGAEAPQHAPSIVRDVLRTPGQPLGESLRRFFKPGFGHDFTQVRLHTDAKAAESARAVGAQAYAFGSHIVFGGNRFSASSERGLRLLAHELVHTMQSPTGASIHAAMEIGGRDAPVEREADRMVDALFRSPRSLPPSPVQRQSTALVRRTPDEPTPLRTDVAHVPAPGRGQGARVHIIRDLMPCECRRVPDVREGVFWNPDLDAFAIAYRHCRGGTTTDVYGEVESSLSSFLSGTTPVQGTARIGFEINVVGRSVGGRIQLEMLGSNVTERQGVGGRAQVVLQGNRWRVYLRSDFLHRIGAQPGDVLDFNLGARLGSITVEAQVSDVLSATPRGSGAGCVDIFGGSMRPCLSLSGGGGRGATVLLELRGEFGGPRVRREECFQCLCPPPTKRFQCLLDVPPAEREVEREIDVQVPGEHRYYFRLDSTAAAEDGELRGQSTRNLDTVSREVRAGAAINQIIGYASPEATEAHNQPLSGNRANVLAGHVRARVPVATPMPEPIAGGELLGRRPAPAPTSRLGEAVRLAGFRSAEDISILLAGEEIPHRELSDQFVSLFHSLPDRADRLALFGLGPGDPLEDRVLRAVDEFLRRPNAGRRPWERVFRLLRVGVVRTLRRERRTVTETERTPSATSVLGEDACREFGQRAERGGSLPPVPRQFRLPRRGFEDRDIECRIDVRPEDRRRGCSYQIPREMRLPASAPRRAPRRFP